jgi:dTDP-4-dehydrorhamnose 3,5-epimerase
MSKEGKTQLIDPEYIAQAEWQEYGRKALIQGVYLVRTEFYPVEDGLFAELVRLDEEGRVAIEGLPPLAVRQINYSELEPGAVKAWHFHQKQDEIWYVPPLDGPVIVGLLDLREGSVDKSKSSRLNLGGGKAYLLYIPKGVAHGIANLGQERARLIYFVDNQFDPQHPDEGRLPPGFGVKEGFWEMSKG